MDSMDHQLMDVYEADKQQCPICGSLFSLASIQTHVEKCLENTERDNQPAKKCKVDKTAAWGCLASANNSPVGPMGQTKRLSNVSGACATKTKRDTVDERNDATADDVEVSLLNKAQRQLSYDVPLAEQMRPTQISDYVGQDSLLSQSSVLRKLIEAHKIPNMILWGPPGCGKTSLARIISNLCKEHRFARFTSFSAVTSGKAEVKEVIKTAETDKKMFKRGTILFMDEIHRFNKAQQDTFLPVVENGLITLIGATTENPSFSLNNALLSRCRVFVFEKLTVCAIEEILLRSLNSLGISCVEDTEKLENSANSADFESTCIEKDAVKTLANFCDGDARVALNGLQLAVQQAQGTKAPLKGNPDKKNRICIRITLEDVKSALMRTHTLYDRAGDEHYNCISALHKSLRGSDDNAALYWLARMLVGGEDPLYIARRLVRFASEDIGLAKPEALQQAIYAYQGCQFIGLPECKVILAQCTVYLARCPKSIEVYSAYLKAEECVKSHEGPLPGVPLHLRNAPTTLMKNLGYGRDYRYNPNYTEPVKQEYLPEGLKGLQFFS